MDIEAGEATAEFTLRAGEGADFVLEIVRNGSPAAETGYVDDALRRTLAFWRDWAGRSTYRGRWREMVTRSALTLKLLCSQTSGAIAAAATFGLPEAIGGPRNWDYRFIWIRDASLTAATLTQLGFKEEATAYARWVRDRYDSFWCIQCLAQAGELEKARVSFEKIHGFANHLGLYAEELGPRGEHLGNFPQAFTHLGLITAALTLDRALSEAA